MKLCPTVVFAGHAECSTISVPSQSGVCYDHRRRIADCRLTIDDWKRRVGKPRGPFNRPCTIITEPFSQSAIGNRQSSILLPSAYCLLPTAFCLPGGRDTLNAGGGYGNQDLDYCRGIRRSSGNGKWG